MIKAGYWVDLSTVKLDDTGDTSTWIQAMPLGEYEHPVHGKISITAERVTRFAANVVAKVRGTDLDIDYDHKAQSGEAAGWVRNAEAREDGLWLLVEWTQDAFTKIRNKAYRYFSPEFADEWEHPKTKQKYADVLFGGGITNRPFLKDILPINMSELDAVAHGTTPPAQGGRMDPKELRKALGLAEDATDEQVNAKLATAATVTPVVTDPLVTDAPVVTETVSKPVAASESALDNIVKLAESSKDPVVKALAEMVSNQGKQLEVAGAALRLTEVKERVTSLSEVAKKKGFDFPPTTRDAITKALTDADKPVADAVFQAFHKLAETGFVPLGEIGETKNHDEPSDAVKVFTDAVDAKMKSKTDMTYTDAVSAVAAEQPKLFAEYREGSFAGRE